MAGQTGTQRMACRPHWRTKSRRASMTFWHSFERRICQQRERDWISFIAKLHGPGKHLLDPGDMPHLAAGADLRLAIEMQGSAARRERLPIARLLADDVFHHRAGMTRWIAERPTGDGADVLLELAGGAGFESPMAGIVHPRRGLVDQA